MGLDVSPECLSCRQCCVDVEANGQQTVVLVSIRVLSKKKLWMLLLFVCLFVNAVCTVHASLFLLSGTDECALVVM